jgi:aspartate racemase
MEQNFYKGRLIEQFGLEVLVPEPDGREIIHHVIYEELCLGVIQESSRQQYQAIIQQLVAAGAQGIILGCTEIELLIQQVHSPVPLFPTTSIHAQAAVAYALQK